jgi:predicted SAM-dependent methyltransferase
VQRLYASHVLEHLAYEDALRALDNSYKALKPGGVFRLIVPDLAARARLYVARADRADPTAARDFMESTVLGERRRPKGLLRSLAAILGGYQHRWMWDEASMAGALAKAGFVDIRRCSFGDSGDPMFARVEQQGRFIDGDIVEMAMEGHKPA